MSEIEPNAVVSDLCRSLSKAEMVLLVSRICEEHWVKTDSLRHHVRKVRQERLRRRLERLEEQSAAAYEELRTLEGRSELPTADELWADIGARSLVGFDAEGRPSLQTVYRVVRGAGNGGLSGL